MISSDVRKLLTKSVEDLIELIDLVEDDEPPNPPIRKIVIESDGQGGWITSARVGEAQPFAFKYAIFTDDMGHQITDGY